MAGLSEFGGGVLTVLGFLNPFGSLGTIGAMAMAATKVHWGKPIWVTAGGAELPVLNIATALALGLAGPGKLSVDNALGIKLPRRLILIPGLALVGVTVAAGLAMSKQAMAEQPQESQEAQAAQPEEQASEAVAVPERPAAGEMQQRDEQAVQEPERVAGAELQAGQDAEHPV
jgi:putative oxidoreductase